MIPDDVLKEANRLTGKTMSRGPVVFYHGGDPDKPMKSTRIIKYADVMHYMEALARYIYRQQENA